ncbi:hypothetical protein EK21DRAFT_97692 [Setomelanomma holmii]|uniref:Uncharacterized protein n=1 Tax=Setomelanomma holmii TaxID=210430 RepID=A0A9P4HGP3_9PLEO|nr:hypothetical protein EK21DRAFT_97692 [Setomelanomma holmii]
MSRLGGKLHESPLSFETRKVILHNLWPALGAYFDYYENQCHHAMHKQGKHILVHTHQQIVDIANNLKQGQPRASIKRDLTRLFTAREKPSNEDETLDNSIDLAARLYLMVNIGAYEASVTQGKKVIWDTPTLKEKIWSHFTENYIIAIFHHASFLECQRDSTLFPPRFIDETLRTLALLFPRHDKQTKKWLQMLPSSPLTDGHITHCQKLRPDDRQIETFRFWHDRLIILKQTFDESRPTKLSQWWYDRRDGYL